MLAINLPTNKKFYLPAAAVMRKDIADTYTILGRGLSVPVSLPSDPRQACMFAFLTLLGNGVLNTIKLFLNSLIVELDTVIIVLEYQVIQAELLRSGALRAEREVTNIVRQIPKSAVNNIKKQIAETIENQTKDSKAGQAFVQGLTLSDALQCSAVAKMFEGFNATTDFLDARLDELDYLIKQETSGVDLQAW